MVTTMVFMVIVPQLRSEFSSSYASDFFVQPGMQLISAFGCLPGESKEIFIGGKEDNYSLIGEENSRVHDRLNSLPGLFVQSAQLRDYDEAGFNKTFSEFFEIPSNISSGFFVVRMKGNGNHTNDNINIGDLLDRDSNQADMAKHLLSIRINKLSETSGWTQTRDLYSARLTDIEFFVLNKKPDRKFDTVLEYIKAQPGNAVLDIEISDDTNVDFTAIAVCQRPVGQRGVSLTSHKTATIKNPELTILTCNGDVRQTHCNPYYGDTPCEQSLPLACFNDQSAPLPATWPRENGFVENWSGGVIAYTPEVQGNSLATIEDANGYCSQSFGPDWRVLSWHDGGKSNVMAHRHDTRASGRAWVDIVDQPDATCWTRESMSDQSHESHDH